MHSYICIFQPNVSHAKWQSFYSLKIIYISDNPLLWNLFSWFYAEYSQSLIRELRYFQENWKSSQKLAIVINFVKLFDQYKLNLDCFPTSNMTNTLIKHFLIINESLYKKNNDSNFITWKKKLRFWGETNQILKFLVYLLVVMGY